MKKLLLKSSTIFEGADVIDCIRQTCIGLKNSPREDEIDFFLNESIQYLKDDLPFNIANELFSAILLCFKQDRKYISNFLSIFLKQVKNNSNYLILSSFILSDLICKETQLTLPEYEVFVEESLSLIIEQIQKEDEKDLILFGHKIPELFKNELIVNFLLSSKLTNERFLSFFPYLFSHNLLSKYPKFDAIIEFILKSEIICISNQTETSDNEIYDFINSEGQCSIEYFSKEAITLIESAVMFIKCTSKKKIKGLKKETILQFLAVIIIIIKEYKIHEKVKFSSKGLLELIIEGTRYLNRNISKVLNKSMELIVSNYFYINGTLSIPLDTFFEIFKFLLKFIDYDIYHGNKMVLYQSIFDLSEKVKYYYNIRESITAFLKENETLIINQLLKYVNEINKDYKFKIKKLDLQFFDQKLIFSKFETFQNKFQIIYFLSNSCINISKASISRAEEQINLLLSSKVSEQKWEEVFLIAKLMKKNNLNFFKSLSTNKSVPFELNVALFDVDTIPSGSAIFLIKNILADPAPEDHDHIFSALFEKLIEDKKLFGIYFTLLITKYISVCTCSTEVFLSVFKKMFIKYGQKFVEVAKRVLDYNFDKNILVLRLDFNINENVQSGLMDQILTILYNEIGKNKQSYQAFYCLMNIASSFPTVFASDPIKVFTTVYPVLDYLSFIFEKKEDEEHLPFIKTGYSALCFLISTFQSSIVVEKYFIWLFSNIISFDNIQVLYSFVILNILNKECRIKYIVQKLVIQYNFFESISTLLERKVQEGYFASCYKDNIYKYITDSYQSYLYYNMHIHAQVEELMKHKHPIAYICDCIHTFFLNIKKEEIKIEVNTSQLNQYIKNVNKNREFWLSFDFDVNQYVYSSKITSFVSHLDKKYAPLSNLTLPELKKPITFRMSRYLTMQKYWVYKKLIYSENVPCTNEMFQQLKNIIEHSNQLKEISDKNNDGEEDIDSDSFSLTDCFSSQYCQESLIKSLVNELFLPSINNRCVSSLCSLFHAYASNDVALLSLLSIISQCFTKISKKCIGYAPPSLLKVLYDLIEILTMMTSIDGFKENFFETCGNNLINIVLQPELRCDPILLWNVCKFFDNFPSLPIRVTQIIGFMILLNNEKVLSAAISLCSKFSYKELADINSLILNLFDNELKNGKRQSFIAILITNSPSILEKRKTKLYSILKGLLKKFSIQSNEKVIVLMGTIMTKLAPERNGFEDLQKPEGKLTEIPPHIKERDPYFWNLFEKYMDPILKLINDDPNYLNKFRFLFNYPELISFKVRSLLVRKTMKEMICNSMLLTLNIDPEQIFETSYTSIINKSRTDLLKKLYIIFKGSKATVDMGGPTREFLSKLAKEIFNAKNGLFACTSKMTYQPSDVSSMQPYYLEYFRFAGIFVARALLEGQCIDAHLTIPFIKQILHQKLTLKDLEDVDEQLFNSMTWLLNNDVEPLDMYFEIDLEKFGVHETIPLKENGSEIKVTNENKNEFVELNIQFTLHKKIKKQINAFCEGFNFLIPYQKINFFTPKEFDLLICGVTDFDVDDFIENTQYEYPYSIDHPVIKMFFNVIRSWDNDKLSKLLSFMTGSQRIPANGFKEFIEITGSPLKIGAGGEENCLPKSHTCFNTMDLPAYSNEDELRDKLLLAIQECDTFALV